MASDSSRAAMHGLAVVLVVLTAHSSRLLVDADDAAAAAVAAAADRRSDPIVRTEYGTIAGITNSSLSLSVFHGVPFAAAPVKTLRWQLQARVLGCGWHRKVRRPSSRCTQPTS